MSESENKIICPSCSAENQRGKKFCMKCGSKLTAAEPEQKSVPEKKTAICPSCSAENPQGKKFCMKCGSKLAAAEHEQKSVPVKNTVIQNTDKSSSRPVFADKPHANVPSEAAAATVKNKIKLKIYCAVIIAILLILVVIALIPNSEISNSEISNSASRAEVTIDSEFHTEVTICGTKYIISETTEDTDLDGAVFEDNYNKTAVSVMETVLEYIGVMPVEERYQYIQISDAAFKAVLKNASAQLLSDISDLRASANEYCITGSFSRDNNGNVFCSINKYKVKDTAYSVPAGQFTDSGYIWDHMKNYTDMRYDELEFAILFSASRNASICFIGNGKNISAIPYNEKTSGVMGRADIQWESVPLTEHDENELTAITNKYANDNDTENSSIDMSDTDTASYSDQNQTEKQIRILEDYYENTLKSMREYDGYKISGAGAGKIYALNDDGDCFILTDLSVDIDGIMGCSITLCCTVDGSGNVNTKKIVDNTGGGVSFQSVEIKKCSVNNKFYYDYYQHGASQSSSDRYVSFDGSEDLNIYMLGVDRLFYVDGYPVTQSSYEEYSSYLDSIMSDPVPTRKDGDVSVYLLDFSAVNNNKIPAGAELMPPENFSAEIIDVSNIKFSWDKVSGDNIIYTVYMVKNGKYIKVLDTTFTYSYSIDGEKTDYCVTANSDSRYVSESGYSNISKAEDNDFRSYSAIDFIGVEFKDLYEYAQKNGGYYSSEQGINCFWIDGIPYEFYGELVDYNSGYVTDNYVRGIEIDEGDRVDGDIIFDKNIVKNLAKKYQQSKAVLEVEGAEGGGLSGINVKIDIGNNLSAVIKYGIPDDPENVYDPMFSFEETEAYYDNIIKKYDNKAIDINDVESVFGTYAISCRIITEGVYLY